MANKVLLKKSSVASKVPTAADLDYGELAINYADEKIYFKNSNNAIKSFSTTGVSLETLTIGTGLSGTNYNGTTASTVSLASSGVTAGSYGSTTAIPVITVDQYGRVTGAGTTSVSTSFSIAGNTGTGSVSNGGTLTLTGSNGIAINASGGTFTVSNDSTIATLTGTQTLTNKSLQDSTTFFIDETDATKKMQFQLSSITTGTTRTLTVPNVNGTIITSGDTGTVTNAMLAGSIANAKLANSSITVNGTAISLGGSATITANTTNSHVIKFDTGTTEGTDLYTFNGSAAKTVDIKAGTNVTLTKAAGVITISANDSSVDWSEIQNKPDPVVTVTLTGDVTGTANTTLTDLASGTISVATTIAANSVALGTDTTGDYVAAVAVSGTGLSVSGSGETATYTITSNATSANTASTIVARDASGNFTAGTITASLSGNASTVTNGVYTTGSYADPAWITSLAKSKVGLSNVENTALSTWAGSSNITTIGAATATSLTVTGDLVVNGTTTTINSTTISVDDKNIELGAVTTPTNTTADGGGITLKGATDKTFNWINATSAWTSSEHLALAAGKNILLNGSTSGTVTLAVPAVAGTTTITFPATTGTVVTTGDSGTVTSSMIADGTIVNGDISASAAIAISKLAASTISGVSLGNNLNTLTLNVSGTGLSGSTTYNGSAAATFTVTSNATSANTASTIVARDGSGNFSAGTITAALTGNASTATTLQTARNINGTSFNGSADITTANWGTARTLTIGSTGKSVNGSADVSWSLAEIGAAAASHNHTSLTGVTSIGFAAEASDSASISTTISGTSTYFDFNLTDDNSNDWWRWRFTPSGSTVYDAMTLKPSANGVADLVVAGTVTGTRLISNVANGTAPLSVTSTTLVSNLNADLLDGLNSATAATANTIAARDANGDLTTRYFLGEYTSMSHAAAARTADTVFYSSTDNYIRKNTAAGFKQSLALNNVENTALSTWAGSSNITTLGTIATGTWNATTIGTAKGGTGLTSFTANGAVYATSTSALTTGTLPVASGGTGVTTSTGSGSVVLSTSPTLVTPVIGAATGTSLTLTGALQAATKSFLIPHPTKEGKKLRYGSLEGPENGVYVRGKLKGSNVIELPEYWTKLIDPDSITVSLTPIGKHQDLFVEDIRDNKVIIANGNLFSKEINCFYTVYGERCDVEKLEVEID